MSIFGSIMSKIFGHSTATAAPAPTAPPSPSQTTPGPTGSFNSPAPAPLAPGQTTPPAAAPAAAPVDVEKILTDLASQKTQKLDWRHSIVDLMKLVDLDSSLSARQALAKELHYSGSMDDSASMNIWLHKKVMQELAANGGKVPDDLKQ